ncbi:MAG: bifunctional folylpolyglutamate synthase/dihydrofolate synthase [Ruminococcus sp.]|nr:bifunctional folylpolyglutamate synthase/dihydrofolate synthase [Ruminococcus sp.]
MDINEAMSFINSYTKSGGKITDLSRAQELMERIGNPEKRLRFVHIAGTNGKGSTLEYISNALIMSGYRVGQFTSPFILRYNDRIRINGEEISDEVLADIAEQVRACVSDRPYSQFEITMAIAFLWFERENCDIVVLETGIGGLLDCTNIIPPPLLSVITSVSLDHTALLGNTVEEIAAHKAGIIKAGSAVVLADDNPDSVKALVKETAERVGAELVPLEPCKPNTDGGLYAQFIYRGIKLIPAMIGLHQKYNAQTAITACLYLRGKGYAISDGNIIRMVETTQVRARVQYIGGEPPFIVDGGHNPSGVNMLSLMLMYLSTRNKRIYAVMGMVDSKDYAECVKMVARQSDRFFAVDGFSGNAVSADILQDIASFYTEAETSSLVPAIESAKALALENGGIAVVCGSLYLASEALKLIEKN